MLFLPVVYAAAVNISITPTPQPTPLKVIVTVRSSTLCTGMHRVIVPFVKTETQNNQRFVSMDKELGKYHVWYRPPGDVATDPNGSPEYNGAQALSAAKIDRQAAQIYGDIAKIEHALEVSLKETPKGRDPKLDDLRKRAYQIIELQRQVADRYEAQAARYLDSLGGYMPMATAQSKGDPALQSAFEIPQIQIDPLSAAQDPIFVHPFSTPQPGSQYGTMPQPGDDTSGQIVTQMMKREYSFVRPAIDAARICNGK